MTSTKDFINDDKAISNNKTLFDSSYYSSRRIPVVLHRREIGKVFAEVKDNLVIIAGENKKEHEYLIPKSKITHFDEEHLCVSIADNSLKEFEIQVGSQEIDNDHKKNLKNLDEIVMAAYTHYLRKD